ncbi:MAG: hypothetical protein ACE5K0_04325 [Candidatus Methanofastidiosia archaeon]
MSDVEGIEEIEKKFEEFEKLREERISKKEEIAEEIKEKEKKSLKLVGLIIIILGVVLLIVAPAVFYYSTLPKTTLSEVTRIKTEEYQEQVTEYETQIVIEEQTLTKFKEEREPIELKGVVYDPSYIKRFTTNVFSFRPNLVGIDSSWVRTFIPSKNALEPPYRIEVRIKTDYPLNFGLSYYDAYLEGVRENKSFIEMEHIFQKRFEGEESFIINIDEKDGLVVGIISLSYNEWRPTVELTFYHFLEIPYQVRENVEVQKQIPITKTVSKKRTVPYRVVEEQKSYPNEWLKIYSTIPAGLGIILIIGGIILRR